MSNGQTTAGKQSVKEFTVEDVRSLLESARAPSDWRDAFAGAVRAHDGERLDKKALQAILDEVRGTVPLVTFTGIGRTSKAHCKDGERTETYWLAPVKRKGRYCLDAVRWRTVNAQAYSDARAYYNATVAAALASADLPLLCTALNALVDCTVRARAAESAVLDALRASHPHAGGVYHVFENAVRDRTDGAFQNNETGLTPDGAAQ